MAPTPPIKEIAKRRIYQKWRAVERVKGAEEDGSKPPDPKVLNPSTNATAAPTAPKFQVSPEPSLHPPLGTFENFNNKNRWSQFEPLFDS